jgi:hypothetical protein
MNDVEASLANEEDEVMEDIQEASDRQSGGHGVSNHLTKSLTITKAGSSKSIDVVSDSTIQEASPEVISIFRFALQYDFCCSLTFGTNRL